MCMCESVYVAYLCMCACVGGTYVGLCICAKVYVGCVCINGCYNRKEVRRAVGVFAVGPCPFNRSCCVFPTQLAAPTGVFKLHNRLIRGTATVCAPLQHSRAVVLGNEAGQVVLTA